MRLGLLGGTFDPPHVGHLLVAIDALETLRLDRLVLIPSAQQPLKVGEVTASPAQRLAMVRLLADGHPALSVDPIEIERGGLSYTVDTLSAYAAREPAAERFFLVGADVLSTFHKWREPERVLALARLVVLRRATGASAALPTTAVPGVPGREPLELATRRVDVSSTEIRARVRAHRPVRGFVPEAIAAYIASEGLYRG